MQDFVYTHNLAYIVVIVVLLALVVYMRRKDAKSVELPTPVKKKLPVVQRCDNCAFFDLKEGQAAMRAHPIWARFVSQVVSPNDMMKRVVDEGQRVLPPEHPLKFSEDNWEMFGLCGKHDHLRHGCDKCEHFLELIEVENDSN